MKKNIKIYLLFALLCVFTSLTITTTTKAQQTPIMEILFEKFSNDIKGHNMTITIKEIDNNSYFINCNSRLFFIPQCDDIIIEDIAKRNGLQFDKNSQSLSLSTYFKRYIFLTPKK